MNTQQPLKTKTTIIVDNRLGVNKVYIITYHEDE